MNRVRKYLLPRLLMPSNFCLPPVEYSPGTIPIQAARFRPFRKALALPTAPIRAVAVTGPTPGISVSLAGFIFFRRFLDDPIHLLNACCELFEFYLELCQQNTKTTRQPQLGVFQDTRKLLIHITSAFGQSQSPFQKKGANLVHHRGPSHHPTLAHAMQGLQIQLLLGLDRTKRILGRCTASAMASH